MSLTAPGVLPSLDLNDPLELDDFALDRALAIDQAILRGRRIDTDVTRGIVDGEIVRSIDGASTIQLSIHDPRFEMLRRRDFRERTRLEVAGRGFVLTSVNPNGTTLDVLLEDEVVNALRQPRGAITYYLDEMTRAEAARAVVRQVKSLPIRFYSPEIHVDQPVAQAGRSTPATRAAHRRRKDARRQPGIPHHANLKVKGKTADAGQLALAEHTLDIAVEMRAPTLAQIALICAEINESLIHNLTYGDRSSEGLLQLLESTARAIGISRRDVDAVVRRFFSHGFAADTQGAIKLARRHPTYSPGLIAHICEGGGTSGTYDRWAPEARAIVAAYHGGRLPRGASGSGGLAGGARTVTRTRRASVSRGRNENSWDALGRWASQVRWRRFVVDHTLYWVTDEDLLHSRSRYRLSPTTEGVDPTSIRANVDPRKKTDTCTITLDAGRFQLPPGVVVTLEDLGALDGDWLVHNVRRNLFQLAAEVELARPSRPLPEPAPDTYTVTLPGRERTGSIKGARGLHGVPAGVLAAYKEALHIGHLGLPYVWGGGHASAGSRSGGGFDCSGYVAACLVAGGFYPKGAGVGRSDGLGARYRPGPGRWMTIYASVEHVFLYFTIPGLRGRRADTSPHGDGPAGPHMRYTPRGHAGFLASHPAGC